MEKDSACELSCLMLLVLAIGQPDIAAGQSPNAVGVGIEQKLGAQVPPDLLFRDEFGNPVRLGELLGQRPVILQLVYYRCPMLCNLAMDGLVRSLRCLTFDPGEEFSVITVSIDPREKPALAAAAKQTALRRYGRGGADEHWHFLTGDSSAIRRLTKQVGFHYEFDPTTGQFAHASGLIVITSGGRTSRYLTGVEYSSRDLRLSLVEASAGKIGTITDQVFLLCFHYDPARGKYGLIIHNVLRLAAGMTILTIGSGVGLMLFHERRKKARAAQQPQASRCRVCQKHWASFQN